jgi:hypothetical protein
MLFFAFFFTISTTTQDVGATASKADSTAPKTILYPRSRCMKSQRPQISNAARSPTCGRYHQCSTFETLLYQSRTDRARIMADSDKFKYHLRANVTARRGCSKPGDTVSRFAGECMRRRARDSMGQYLVDKVVSISRSTAPTSRPLQILRD